MFALFVPGLLPPYRALSVDLIPLPFHCDFAPLEHVHCVAEGSFSHGLMARHPPLDCYSSFK